MTISTAPLDTDRRFFKALLAADVSALEALLTDDFVLVDVMRGGEIPRAVLLAALGSGTFHFDAIELVESRARTYGDASVVVGRTNMRGRAGDQAWSVTSRYTHVFVIIDGAWHLASAQGTAIATD
jgi:ketosteroid isomerase-like protein